VSLSPAQTNGQQLAVTASDAAGNTSPSTAVTAPVIADTEPPLPPDAVISADGATVSGTAEPLSTVRVLGPGGGVIGIATAGADGVYSITLDPPLTAGEALNVTATDAAGNTSDPTPLTAPVVADTEPPLPPIAIFSADGATVTGTTEAGATVRLFDASNNQVGFAVADGAGAYTITLTPPIIDGQTLTATATDEAGNTSGPTTVQAPDLIDRDPPEILVAEVAVNGAAVTGTTDEEGATVTVRDAAGNVIGEGVAGPGGVFSIPLTPPLIAGERLSLIATDAAGNASDPTFVNAPNTAGSVIARDDIATAALDVVPDTNEVDEIDSATYLLLVSLGVLNLQATVLGTASVEFDVQQGQSLDATFEYDALLSLGVLSNYQLVVQRWDGTQWTAVAGSGQATLLELNLLTGTPSVDLSGLGPGEYRAFMTFRGVGLGLLGDLTVGGTYTDLTSIVDIEGEPATGNVMDGDARTPTTVVQSVEGQTVAATGQTTIAGLYGVLTIDASGAYTYVPNEDAANIGQVDAFEYTITDTVTSVSSTATLYVRIDSPDVDLVWDDTDPGAPATYAFDATPDAGLAAVEFANVSRGIYDHVENIQLVGLLSTRTYTGAAFTVAPNVDVSGSASINMLAAIASSGGLALQQQNAQGGWSNVLNVPYNVLVGLLGPVAQIDLATLDLGPGNYRFVATVRGVGGVGASVNIDVNGTFLTEYQVVDTDGTTGNLLANDVPGSALTQLQVFNVDSGAYETVQAGTTVTIQGQYGSLTLDAGGNYTYTPDDDVAYFNQPVTETFDYRLLHPTGDTADGELVVTVQPGGAGIAAVPASFDLDAMTMDAANEDAGAPGEGGDDYLTGLLRDASHPEPLMVRGEGDTVFDVGAPREPAVAGSAAWEVDYLVPMRHDDNTDALLSQQTLNVV